MELFLAYRSSLHWPWGRGSPWRCWRLAAGGRPPPWLATAAHRCTSSNPDPDAWSRRPSHDRPASPCIYTHTPCEWPHTHCEWPQTHCEWPLYTCRHIVNDHHMTAQQAPAYTHTHNDHTHIVNDPCIHAGTLWMTITWPPSKPLHTHKHIVNDAHVHYEWPPSKSLCTHTYIMSDQKHIVNDLVCIQAHCEWPS